MPRIVGNGAVVSDSGNWVWASTQWLRLVPNPADKAPGAVFGSERAAVARLVHGKSMGDQRKAAEELVSLVREVGSLAGAEQVLIERAHSQAAARRDVRSSLPSAPSGRRPESEQTLVKTYKDGKDFEKDARRMIAEGWQPDNQSAMDGHVNLGRTLGKTVLTGGLGLILTGASRTKGQLTVTWIRPQATAGDTERANDGLPDKYDRLMKLGELREKGLVSEDEFEAEKARLLKAE